MKPVRADFSAVVWQLMAEGGAVVAGPAGLGYSDDGTVADRSPSS